jgi:PiT family inorganic phosphate transporter
MTEMALTGTIVSPSSPKPKLDQPVNPLTLILFFGVLAARFLFVACSLYVDVDETGAKVTTYLMGWVLTLPAAIMLSATLYWTFSQVF